MLIYARKILNCWVSFRILLPMCLVLVKKELPIKKIPITVTKVIFVSFLTIVSKQENKNEHKKYQGISIPFKTQVYSN